MKAAFPAARRIRRSKFVRVCDCLQLELIAHIEEH